MVSRIAPHLRMGFIRSGKMLGKDIKKNVKVPVDTLVGVGISGAIVVPRAAEALGMDWVIVRKATDIDAHSNNEWEGFLGKEWLFVDDIISSGATFNRAYQVLKDHWASRNSTFVGAYFYHRPEFMTASEVIKRYLIG